MPANGAHEFLATTCSVVLSIIKILLPSYIPLRPHLPQNHYNIAKTGLLNGNDLWKNRHKKNGRFARIYHQSCSDWGFWVDYRLAGHNPVFVDSFADSGSSTGSATTLKSFCLGRLDGVQDKLIALK